MTARRATGMGYTISPECPVRLGYRHNADGLRCTVTIRPVDLEANIHVIRLGRICYVSIPEFFMIEKNLFSHVAFRDS